MEPLGRPYASISSSVSSVKPPHGTVGLQLVELVVAGNEQHHQIARIAFARERLHGGRFGNVQECRQLGDGMHAGRGYLLHFRHVVLGGARQAVAGFRVGRVSARAVHELGLARFGERHELAGHAAADLPGIGLDGTVVQAQALADAAVGGAHVVVGLLQRLLMGVEAVGVLHDELAAAQEAEAWADLVAELRLDLVERQRKLLVRAQLVAHESRDELFVGGPQADLVVVTVGEAHELGAVVVPTAALAPQLARLQRGHEHLLCARGVHFLAHDLLHLREHLLPQGQKRVHARRRLAYHAGPHEQAMACYFRIGGVFLQRRRVHPAHVHHIRHSFPISSINTSTMSPSATLRTTSP